MEETEPEAKNLGIWLFFQTVNYIDSTEYVTNFNMHDLLTITLT